MRLLTLTLTVAVLGAAPASAMADVLVAPAPGAVNLAGGGGYLAWFAPPSDSVDSWHLMVRTPDGTLARPAIAAFDEPTPLAIGSGVNAAPTDPRSRPLLAVYGRDDGDLYAYDLRAGGERRLSALSTRAYREHAPSIQYGTIVFARSGGRRPGVYVASPRGSVRRLSAAAATATAFNGSRYAYTTPRAVTVRRLSGEGRPLRFATTSRPLSPLLTRYRVGWLQSGGRAFQTPRFAGSGGPFHVDRAAAANRLLPATTQSVGLDGDVVGLYLDAEGVKRAVPRLF